MTVEDGVLALPVYDGVTRLARRRSSSANRANAVRRPTRTASALRTSPFGPSADSLRRRSATGGRRTGRTGTAKSPGRRRRGCEFDVELEVAAGRNAAVSASVSGTPSLVATASNFTRVTANPAVRNRRATAATSSAAACTVPRWYDPVIGWLGLFPAVSSIRTGFTPSSCTGSGIARGRRGRRPRP